MFLKKSFFDKKLVLLFVVLIVLTGCFVLIVIGSCSGERHSKSFNGPVEPVGSAKMVGIILPMEHRALREIVDGFKAALSERYRRPLQFKVVSANNDVNMQRALIEQMRDQKYDLIVPVTTGTAKMAASLVKHIPLVALAAEYSDTERQQQRLQGQQNQQRRRDQQAQQDCNVAVVNDEIDKLLIVDFMRQVYPQLHKISLVHGVFDKAFKEAERVAAAVAMAEMPSYGANGRVRHGIVLQRLMVHNLSELYSVGMAVAADSEAILVLKDSLIASGIHTLVKIAQQRRIPLVTADDGTVKEGASFAVGVEERQIGAEGGVLAAQILSGKVAHACQLPIVVMSAPTVFVNPAAQTAQSLQQLRTVARRLHYRLEIVGQAEQVGQRGVNNMNNDNNSRGAL
jgi:putative tryptophan/tyrosine transport system substrate-binding protein